MSEGANVARATDRPGTHQGGLHSTFARQAVSLIVEALDDERWIVSIRDAHTDLVIEMLLDGVLDVGFVLAGARPPQLRFVPLQPDPVLCVCASGHALARRRRVSVSSLSHYKVAFNRWGSGVDEMLSLLGVPLMCPCGSGQNVPTPRPRFILAQHHGYVAFVGSSFVEDDIAAGRMSRVHLQRSTKWSVGLTLAYPSKDAKRPAIEVIARAARSL